MKHSLDGETLTIFLEGELNAYTSETVEKDIKDLLDKTEFTVIVLNMEKLTYISSAGMRLIVWLKQQYNETSVESVSEPVYRILDMVGFPKMIKIEKLSYEA